MEHRMRPRPSRSRPMSSALIDSDSSPRVTACASWRSRCRSHIHNSSIHSMLQQQHCARGASVVRRVFRSLFLRRAPWHLWTAPLAIPPTHVLSCGRTSLCPPWGGVPLMPHAARPPIVSTPHAVLAVAEGRACLGVSGPRASRERGLCVCWWCGVCVALLAHPGAIYDLRLPTYSPTATLLGLTA